MIPADELARLRKRVDELEALAAFQDQTLSQLDAVVREFAGRVEGLEQGLGQLRQQLAGKEADAS